MDNRLAILDTGKSKNFQHFIEWFIDAWKESGGESIPEISIPRKLRAVLSRLFCFNVTKKSRLVVCGGFRINFAAWPWCYKYDIVPVMWDLWPANYDAFVSFLKRCRVRDVFCTSTQGVEYIRNHTSGVRVTWMPEAINVSRVPCGKPLLERCVDIINYGRRLPKTEDAIKHLADKDGIKYTFDGGATFDDLTAAVRSAKISICYPMCDTNAAKARGVETLTQRYWEGMLSGTLICGRAPKELIEVCGYNPVVELGDDPESVLKDVLKDIKKYQELVDKNRKTAEERGSWTTRVAFVKGILSK